MSFLLDAIGKAEGIAVDEAEVTKELQNMAEERGQNIDRLRATMEKNNQLLLRKATAAYPLDDYLLIGDFEGYLHALKSEDGSFVARFKTDGSAIAISPVTLGDGALIQTSDGELYSLSIRK